MKSQGSIKTQIRLQVLKYVGIQLSLISKFVQTTSKKLIKLGLKLTLNLIVETSEVNRRLSFLLQF